MVTPWAASFAALLAAPGEPGTAGAETTRLETAEPASPDDRFTATLGRILTGVLG
ncbi:hypothetical protein [Streptacidiphilus anmyonensis]|uniref:hypothetical protein n=1 Tax=Streptacidiphilus anmyonensis TaxID=405782 RepID=UPI000AF2CFDA|nr:hypothetical protein [Streptacidiphilus anmyonensis]